MGEWAEDAQPSSQAGNGALGGGALGDGALGDGAPGGGVPAGDAPGGGAPGGDAPSSAPRRKKRSCFVTGCLSVLVILFVMVAVIGGFVLTLPLLLAPAAPIEMVESQQVVQDYMTGYQAVGMQFMRQLETSGVAVAELELPENVANALIVSSYKQSPELAGMIEGVRLRMLPGAVQIDAIGVLPPLPVPKVILPQRIGISVRVAVDIDGNVLRIKPQGLKLGHLPLPVRFAFSVASGNMPPAPPGMSWQPDGSLTYQLSAMQVPDAPVMVNLKSLRLEEGKMVLAVEARRK